MERACKKFLLEWISSTSRKPLVIRGARQVGKTWLVRDFARSEGLNLIELNFEKRPDLESLFKTNDVEEILVNLETFSKKKIEVSNSLLFLDEIQAAPHLLTKLRWFYEDIPKLKIIAAGSLLEFILDKHEFSMPVGRINYMHLEPFSFEEFLDAIGQKFLKEYVEKFDWDKEIPKTIHLQLMRILKEYMLIGGMPEAISAWINTKNLDRVNQVHFDLLATYRDDFSKYSGKFSSHFLEEIMSSVPRQLGNKFVLTKINPNISSSSLKKGLDLLSKARICHNVFLAHANGLPIGAEVNEKYRKMIMLDCGLCFTSLGLSFKNINSISEIDLINRGGIAEQIVGQQLRTITPFYIQPSLYYWQRTKKGSNAEIDYVFQHKNMVIPIEVKAGKTGSLKSLHQFMNEKKKKIAVRINSDYPKKSLVKVKDSFGIFIEYTLFSIPFYLIGQLKRLF